MNFNIFWENHILLSLLTWFILAVGGGIIAYFYHPRSCDKAIMSPLKYALMWAGYRWFSGLLHLVGFLFPVILSFLPKILDLFKKDKHMNHRVRLSVNLITKIGILGVVFEKSAECADCGAVSPAEVETIKSKIEKRELFHISDIRKNHS